MYLTKKIFIPFLLVFLFLKVYGQNGGDWAKDSYYIYWQDLTLTNGIIIKIEACIDKPFMGQQSIRWGITNKMNQSIHLTYTKVYTLVNGRKVKKKGEWTWKPGEKIRAGWTHTDLADTFDTQQEGRVSTCTLENIIGNYE